MIGPNNQNMTPEQQEEALINYMLNEYDKKTREGIISIDVSGNHPVLVHKQFDEFGKETDSPLKLTLSATSKVRTRIRRRQQRDQIELQIANLQEQLDNFDAGDDGLYAKLEADIAKAQSKSKEAKEATKVEAKPQK